MKQRDAASTKTRLSDAAETPSSGRSSEKSSIAGQYPAFKDQIRISHRDPLLLGHNNNNHHQIPTVQAQPVTTIEAQQIQTVSSVTDGVSVCSNVKFLRNFICALVTILALVSGAAVGAYFGVRGGDRPAAAAGPTPVPPVLAGPPPTTASPVPTLPKTNTGNPTTEPSAATTTSSPLSLSTNVLLDGTDSNDEISNLLYSSGNYTIIRNPLIDDPLNPSSLVIRYQPDPDLSFDVIGYGIPPIPNLEEFVSGKVIITMDLLTTTTDDTNSTTTKNEILLQLFNRNVANDTNYPIGIHSAYLANFDPVITAWQRVSFGFSYRPDDREELVDAFTVFFALGMPTKSTFIFDNMLTRPSTVV